MGETTTLTIRIDEDLKADLERAARAGDQSVTDYVIRAVKARMLPECGTCGRSSEHFVGAGLTPAFRTFLATWKKEKTQNTVTVLEGSERRAYTGNLHNVDQGDGMIFMTVKGGQSAVLVPIPIAIITGWTQEIREDDCFRALLALGYVDGNAWALRGLPMKRR